MTTYLGKSSSFGLPRVPFVNCRQFMYYVISLLVLRAGCGIWLYQFLIIAYLFTLVYFSFFLTIEQFHTYSVYNKISSNRIVFEPRHEKKNWLWHMQTTKAQISLRIRASWSAPLLFASYKYSTSNCYIQNFKTLASFWSWAGRFESYLLETWLFGIALTWCVSM